LFALVGSLSVWVRVVTVRGAEPPPTASEWGPFCAWARCRGVERVRRGCSWGLGAPRVGATVGAGLLPALWFVAWTCQSRRDFVVGLTGFEPATP
jgi:hypothetical protein